MKTKDHTGCFGRQKAHKKENGDDVINKLDLIGLESRYKQTKTNMEDTKQPSEKKKFRDLVTSLADTTGMHGIPSIRQARSYRRKMFWILVILTGFGMVTWQVTMAVLTYYSWPTKTTTTVGHSQVVDFPAVTICNLNPVRKSEVEACSDGAQGHELRTLFSLNRNTGSSSTNSSGVTSAPSVTSATMSPPTPAGQEYFDWASSTNAPNYYNQIDDEYQRKLHFIRYYAGYPKGVRHGLGHQIRDMLISCRWQGYKCSPANFTAFTNYMYGNCFTFNTGADDEEVLQVSNAGPLYGLTLELYVEEEEYIGDVSDATGMRVVIHKQDYMPLPEDQGFNVKPGTLTSVGLHRTEIVRAAEPYGRCQNFTEEEVDRKNVYRAERDSVHYTTQTCKHTCFQRKVAIECGCFDKMYPVSNDSIPGGDTLHPCGRNNNEEEKNCNNEMAKDFKKGELDCNTECPPLCVEEKYDILMSMASWPTEDKQESILDTLGDRSQELENKVHNDTETGLEYLKANLLKIEVYFRDLDYEKIVTESSYSITDLLSSIGGQVGLWLGFSAITLCELIAFSMDATLLMFTNGGKVENMQKS